MKRKIHEATIREKILKTARHLLIEQGYENTTIRQITKECDVKIGTVYHFFKNKEDIFSFIAQTLFDRVVNKAHEGIDENNNCLIFAREIRLHLNIIFNDPKSRELYLVAYNSPLIAARILQKTISRDRELFSEYCSGFTEEDYFTRACFINGCLQALAVQHHNTGAIDPSSVIPRTIQIMLQNFNVPHPVIDKTLSQL